MRKLILLFFLTNFLNAQQVIKKPIFKDKNANYLVLEFDESINEISQKTSLENTEENRNQIESEIANINGLVYKAKNDINASDFVIWQRWAISSLNRISVADLKEIKEFIESWKNETIENINSGKIAVVFPAIPNYKNSEIYQISEMYKRLVIEYSKSAKNGNFDKLNNIALRVLNDTLSDKEDIEKWHEWNIKINNFLSSKQVETIDLDLSKEYKTINIAFPKAPLFDSNQLNMLAKSYQEKVSNYYKNSIASNQDKKKTDIQDIHFKIDDLVKLKDIKKWEKWQESIFFYFYLRKQVHPVYVNFKGTKIYSTKN